MIIILALTALIYRSRKASLGGDSSYEIDCSEFAVKLENGIQKVIYNLFTLFIHCKKFYD